MYLRSFLWWRDFYFSRQNVINSNVDQNHISFSRIYVYVDLETDTGDIKW